MRETTEGTTTTIEVRCGCGRGGWVPSELAGRRIRCRGCKGALRVPRPELTPTMKLRRKVIGEHHAEVIEGLYAEV